MPCLLNFSCLIFGLFCLSLRQDNRLLQLHCFPRFDNHSVLITFVVMPRSLFEFPLFQSFLLFVYLSCSLLSSLCFDLITDGQLLLSLLPFISSLCLSVLTCPSLKPYSS